jgi:hypothetical protein
MDDEVTYRVRGEEFYRYNNAPVWPHRYRELPELKTGGGSPP